MKKEASKRSACEQLAELNAAIGRCTGTCKGQQTGSGDLRLKITQQGEFCTSSMQRVCEVRSGEIEHYRAKS
jgi:hypothetical protein